MSGEPTKKATEHADPTNASLEEMPEITEARFRRRPGRGHHTGRSVGEIVAIDADLWPHFGSERAVNEALRRLVEKARDSSPSPSRSMTSTSTGEPLKPGHSASK